MNERRKFVPGVYLVGAGPGDPGLITLRGAQLLGAAEVCIYDHLVHPALLDLLPPECDRVFAGKSAGRFKTGQDDITDMLIEYGRTNRIVVRLKGGDPFVFGRGGEEMIALTAAGLHCEVVPGVTSGAAAPAYAGIPVTHRNLTSMVVFVTGHEDPAKQDSAVDWRLLARLRATLCVYMGVSRCGDIVRELIDGGLDPATPAACVERGTQPGQRQLRCAAADLPARMESAGIDSPAMIVIGAVAAVEGFENWFTGKPLFGQRVIITRAAGQASELAGMVEELGAQVLRMPAIEIQPIPAREAMEQALNAIRPGDVLVWTSPNGARRTAELLEAMGRDIRAFAGCLTAAVGPSTARALKEHTGLIADLLPGEDFRGEGVLKALIGRLQSPANLWLFQAREASRTLPEGLKAAGHHVHELVLYQNVEPEFDLDAFEQAADDPHTWALFTSSSTARNFMDLLVRRGHDPEDAPIRAVSIGPVTSETLRELGVEPAAEAHPSTLQGLVEALVRAVQRRKE
ncbi:MAG: Siroheme synthase [Myxococcota bacterium]|nr:Siroheme synthase [Myxococcota bacterium]